eukprot:g1884.t1
MIRNLDDKFDWSKKSDDILVENMVRANTITIGCVHENLGNAVKASADACILNGGNVKEAALVAAESAVQHFFWKEWVKNAKHSAKAGIKVYEEIIRTGPTRWCGTELQLKSTRGLKKDQLVERCGQAAGAASLKAVASDGLAARAAGTAAAEASRYLKSNDINPHEAGATAALRFLGLSDVNNHDKKIKKIPTLFTCASELAAVAALKALHAIEYRGHVAMANENRIDREGSWIINVLPPRGHLRSVQKVTPKLRKGFAHKKKLHWSEVRIWKKGRLNWANIITKNHPDGVHECFHSNGEWAKIIGEAVSSAISKIGLSLIGSYTSDSEWKKMSKMQLCNDSTRIIEDIGKEKTPPWFKWNVPFPPWKTRTKKWKTLAIILSKIAASTATTVVQTIGVDHLTAASIQSFAIAKALASFGAPQIIIALEASRAQLRMNAPITQISMDVAEICGLHALSLGKSPDEASRAAWFGFRNTKLATMYGAVTRVQAIIRKVLEQKQSLKLHEAATAIQALRKGRAERLWFQFKFEFACNDPTIAKNKVKNQIIERHFMAQKIQSHGRCFLTRKKYLRKKNFAVTTQSLIRGYLGRIKAKRKASQQELQKEERMLLEELRKLEYEGELERQVIVIQSYVRRWQAIEILSQRKIERVEVQRFAHSASILASRIAWSAAKASKRAQKKAQNAMLTSMLPVNAWRRREIVCHIKLAKEESNEKRIKNELKRKVGEWITKQSVRKSFNLDVKVYVLLLIGASLSTFFSIRPQKLYNVNEGLRQNFRDKPFFFPNQPEVKKTFDDIETISDLWEFFDDVIIDGLFATKNLDERTSISTSMNGWVGLWGVRIRQIREREKNLGVVSSSILGRVYDTFDVVSGFGRIGGNERFGVCEDGVSQTNATCVVKNNPATSLPYKWSAKYVTKKVMAVPPAAVVDESLENMLESYNSKVNENFGGSELVSLETASKKCTNNLDCINSSCVSGFCTNSCKSSAECASNVVGSIPSTCLGDLSKNLLDGFCSNSPQTMCKSASDCNIVANTCLDQREAEALNTIPGSVTSKENWCPEITPDESTSLLQNTVTVCATDDDCSLNASNIVCRQVVQSASCISPANSSTTTCEEIFERNGKLFTFCLVSSGCIYSNEIELPKKCTKPSCRNDSDCGTKGICVGYLKDNKTGKETAGICRSKCEEVPTFGYCIPSCKTDSDCNTLDVHEVMKTKLPMVCANYVAPTDTVLGNCFVNGVMTAAKCTDNFDCPGGTCTGYKKAVIELSGKCQLKPKKGCPCINPWALQDIIGDQREDSGLITESVRSISGDKYSIYDYGESGCFEYDKFKNPKCIDTKTGIPIENRPSYCNSRWCYVDSLNCNADTTTSIYFPNVKIMTTNSRQWQRLHFSYDTCVQPNKFEKEKKYCNEKEVLLINSEDDHSEVNCRYIYRHELITKAPMVTMKAGTYSGSGYVRTLSYRMGKEVARKDLEMMKIDFIDTKTRAIFVKMMLYNASFNRIASVKIVFEINVNLISIGFVDSFYFTLRLICRSIRKSFIDVFCKKRRKKIGMRLIFRKLKFWEKRSQALTSFPFLTEIQLEGFIRADSELMEMIDGNSTNEAKRLFHLWKPLYLPNDFARKRHDDLQGGRESGALEITSKRDDLQMMLVEKAMEDEKKKFRYEIDDIIQQFVTLKNGVESSSNRSEFFIHELGLLSISKD